MTSRPDSSSSAAGAWPNGSSRVLLAAFGAGLVWGGVVVTWGA